MATELQKKWDDRIRRAKKLKAEWEDQFSVKMLRAYFEGQQNPGYPEEEWITVNKFYSHLQSQLPMLYSMDPYFYVKLKKSFHPLASQDSPDAAMEHAQIIMDYELKGQGRQSMLNYLKAELGMKRHARLAIQDAHFAFGVTKTRRASDSEEHPHAGEVMKTESGEDMVDENGEPMVYPDTRPVNERYEYQRIHPDDIIFGEDSGPLEESWDWIGQHISMTKADALKDKRFTAKMIRDVAGRARGADKEDDQKSSFWAKNKSKNSDEDEFLDFWEIYDIKNREWLMYVENGEDLAIKPRGLPPGVEKHPFEILRFTLRDSSPYPIPPMFPGLDPQKEYNLSRSQILTHRKRFNRKYEVDTTTLEDADTELAKLEAGDDGTIIRKMGGGKAVEAIQDAPLDQQRYSELALLNNDMNELLGSPDSARGIASADSATEASLLDRNQDVKEGDRMSQVVDWILEGAKKLDMLVQVHIDRDEAVKVVGPEGERWVTIRERDYEKIEGEYEYSVNVGASRPRLPDIERAQWIAFMSQVVIPMPQILTAPNMMKRMAEMFHIEDDAAIEELKTLGQQMVSGQMPMPGNQGGGPSDNPIAQLMGAAGGAGGGNANGGGSQVQN